MVAVCICFCFSDTSIVPLTTTTTQESNDSATEQLKMTNRNAHSLFDSRPPSIRTRNFVLLSSPLPRNIQITIEYKSYCKKVVYIFVIHSGIDTLF